MSHGKGMGSVRWGNLKKVSNDKGPYKIATFEADGKDIDAIIFDPFGVQANPHSKAHAMILTPDGDEGRAIAFVMPAPAKRTDGQKEGEVSYVNHETGNVIKHDADGNTVVKTKGVFHVNPPG